MEKINFKHSLIFFNFCILISPFYLMVNYEPIIFCLILILILGISHGALDNLKGKIISDQTQKIVKLEEYKILSFWDKINELGIWNWSKKYPVKEPELEQLLDGYRWELKLRDRNGKAKYCSGYMSFPRKFKELIKELNILFGSNIKF